MSLVLDEVTIEVADISDGLSLQLSRVLQAIGGPGALAGIYVEPSVRTFGAKGDGVANDSAAFAAAAAGSQPIAVPGGIYRADIGEMGPNPYVFDYGAALESSAGGLFAGTLGGVGIGQFLKDSSVYYPNSYVSPHQRFRAMAGPLPAENNQFGALSENLLWYNARATGNAYLIGSIVSRNFIQYGSGVPASGSMALFGGQVNVIGVAAEATGRSEITPFTIGAICDPASQQYNLNMYLDFYFTGPITQQESYLCGANNLVNKCHPGTVVDANHNGAYGSMSTTSPGAQPGGAPYVTTYPLTALCAATGFSGAPTLTDGHEAGATWGAIFGFRSGGPMGGWGDGASSMIRYGFGAYDWTDTAFYVPAQSRHPSAPVGTPGIYSAYPAQIGVDGQFGDNITLVQNYDASGSRRQTLRYDNWVLGQAQGGTPTMDFALYSAAAARVVMEFDAIHGYMAVPGMPTANAGLASGTLYQPGGAGTPVYAA